jgi:hypothetical protein
MNLDIAQELEPFSVLDQKKGKKAHPLVNPI